MRFGTTFVPSLQLSEWASSGISRPSRSSLAHSGVLGNAFSSPTIAAWMPESWMKRY
ncbi:MAG: hypothetical protein M5U08_17695 [Burkholderiales bacterium]|nr:hypothetical protein [Burkholderiales bacterium]